MGVLEPQLVIRPPCPAGWNYENFAGYKTTMQPRLAAILLRIRGAQPPALLTICEDTRPLHGELFNGLTFPHFEYYAGHYRGEPLWCLDQYRVRVNGDTRVGHDPAIVPMEMTALAGRIHTVIQLMDVFMEQNSDGVDDAQKLVAYVSVATAIFVEFLEVHPYANGNGHMARFIVLALLGRRKIYPTSAWSIDPRPADPPYTNLISKYRNGDREPLVQFIMDAL